jgi:hypothetical protein
MTERDVREGLRGAVAGEPPLDFDPDALVAAARQERRRRRALVSASLATVAVAVAAVAVPVVLGMTRDQDGLGPGEHPAASSTAPNTPTPNTLTPNTPTPNTLTPNTPTPSDSPPASEARREYTAKDLHRRGQQMRVALEERLVVAVPDALDVATQPFGGEAAGAVEDGQDYLNTFMTFTRDGKRYGIGVNVFAPGAHPVDADQLCAADPDGCEWLGGSGYLFAVEENADSANPTLRIVSVYDLRPDGSVVSIVGYNYDPTGAVLPSKETPLPVSAKQLGLLAVDPALGL